jgi:hypothetical protein
MLKPNRIAEICSRFAGKKILVYGDVILDRYIFGQVERISPEAPVPVVTVEHEESRLGGAGNVAANIDRLGARGQLLGVVGRDSFANEIARLKPAGNRLVHDAKTAPSSRRGSFPSASRSCASTAKSGSCWARPPWGASAPSSPRPASTASSSPTTPRAR